MENILNKRLLAIIPEYIDQMGDCTIIYSMGEEPLIVEKSIRTVLKNIGKELMVDLREIKRRYGLLVSSPNLVPIPLSQDDIFIPLKVRKPLCRNDRAFGYINLKYIKDVKTETESTIIVLKDGTSIECLCSHQTVQKQLKNARVVKECYLKRSINVAEDETIYEDGKIVIKVVVQSS